MQQDETVVPKAVNNPNPIPQAKAVEPDAVLVKKPEEPVGESKFKVLHQYRRYLIPVTSDPLIKAYFEILATILLISFFALFAIRPTLNTIAELVKKRQELVQVDETLAGKIKSLIAAQAVYSSYEDKLPLLDEAMPSSPKIDDLVVKLEQAIADNGLEKTGITISKIGLTPDSWDQTLIQSHKKIPVDFTIGVNGHFANANNFIIRVANLERLVDLGQVTLSSSKSDKNSLSVTVTGKAFFLP